MGVKFSEVFLISSKRSLGDIHLIPSTSDSCILNPSIGISMTILKYWVKWRNQDSVFVLWLMIGLIFSIPISSAVSLMIFCSYVSFFSTVPATAGHQRNGWCFLFLLRWTRRISHRLLVTQSAETRYLSFGFRVHRSLYSRMTSSWSTTVISDMEKLYGKIKKIHSKFDKREREW